MVRSRFEKELKALRTELNKMTYLVIEAIEECVVALKTQNIELAKQIVENDVRINQMERAIEARCYSLILKQQPIASDLRMISTALKVVTDLERIGDQSADIAKIITTLQGDSMYRMIEHIPDMARVAKKMVKGAIDAFNTNDLVLANQVVMMDDEMDEYFIIVKEEISESIKSDIHNTDIGINFIIIAKYFERIGDHATNICEWAEFKTTGSVNEHRLL